MNILEYIPDGVRQFSIWGNTGDSYIIAALIFLLLFTLFRTFHHAVLWRLEVLAQRTATDVDDTLMKMIRRIRPWFYVILAFYLALWLLEFPPETWRILNALFIVTVVYQVVQSIGILVEYLVEKRFTDDEQQAGAIAHLLTQLIKGVLWVFGGIFILSNLGVDVTSLITGLGIGGVAVALALQAILGDLFSSFTIYFDKPFAIGDFIIVGDKMGTVESVGIKTTRLRALSGEEIVMSNSELTSAQIHNYRDTDEFRGTFTIGVTYQTSAEDLDRVKTIVSEEVNSKKTVRLERVNMIRFDDSAISFEVSFYTQTPSYDQHMAAQHEILRDIKKRLDEEGISFAYPTRTVYLNQ